MVALKDLTPEERYAARWRDIRVMPRTETELYHWVRGYFGWQMARRSICQGHHAPLSVLADLVFERLLDGIILANRNGGKTALLAVANVIDALFKEKCEVASIGAILAQAKKCYRYFKDMIEIDLLEGEAVYLTEALSSLRNGSEVRVLPGTDTGVNSPHPHKARADEVELIEWGILQQFFSMARSERGIMGQNILASTRKTLYGSMQKLVDKVEKDRSFPFELRQWCIWEVLAPNPRGGPDCPCRSFERGDGKTFYDACGARCRESDGFYVLNDAWRKFSTLDVEVWDSEWECLRPARKGVVYKDMPDDRFMRLELGLDRETFGFCDWGFVDPFTFYIAQTDTQDNIYVLREIYTPGLEPSSMVERASDLFEEMGLSRGDVVIYPDPRGSAEIAEFQKAGFVMRPRAVEIDAGVKWVKKWVKGHNHPKLFVDPEMCPNLKWEMTEGYQYRPNSEVPGDKNNHGCDGLRYGVCGRFLIRNRDDAAPEVPLSAGDGRKSSAVPASAARAVRDAHDERRRAEEWSYPRPTY